MKKDIYIVDIESIPNRYSCEWKEYVPKLLKNELPDCNIIVIEGKELISDPVTPGAFLNFGGTMSYKSDQLKQIANLFTLNEIKPGSHFIFTDAWNPAIINIKYMSALLNIPVKLHGLWHAGSYDKWDFLGRLIGDADWIRYAEKSIFNCLDYNYFASNFHIKLFTNVMGIPKDIPNNKIIRTGWPMTYTSEIIKRNPLAAKENIIVYPHRIAPEKRIDLFNGFSYSSELSDYAFVIPMDLHLNKQEYHDLLYRAKYVVSFAEQETLGISMYEGVCAGCIPIVPDKLSYSEMYFEDFKISAGTNMISQTVNKIKEFDKLIDSADSNPIDIEQLLIAQQYYLNHWYFSAGELIENLIVTL